jgi:predicted SprT family Zn-dependent metalloprotease
MDINEVKKLARETMNQHGLTQWRLAMIRSKSYAGMCKTGRWDLSPASSWGTIELSIDYMEAFDRANVLNTILHEIAHALDKPRTKTVNTAYGKRQRAVHHDATWKAIAKRIGCTGERCVSPDAPKPKGRYKGICPNGHESVRHRLTHTAKHNSSCAQCSKTYNSAYMFDWYDNGVLIHTRPKTLGATTGRMSQTGPDLKAVPVPNRPMVKTPYVPKPTTVFTFDSDTDLTPEQIRILNGLLTKV